MTIISAFNEVDGWDDATGATPTTDAAVAVAGINRAGCKFSGTGQPHSKKYFDRLVKGWVHFRMKAVTDNGADSGAVMWGLYQRTSAQAAVPLVSLAKNGNYTTSNKIVTPWGTATAVLTDLTTYDVNVNWSISTSGYIRVYAKAAGATSDTLIYEYVGDTTNGGVYTGVDMFSFGYPLTYVNSAYYTMISHVIIATTSTFSGVVYTLPVTARGTYNGWTGDVSEVIGTSAATGSGLTALGDNQTQTFVTDDLPALPAGVEVNAIVVSSDSRYAENSDVTRQSAVAVIGGVVYESVVKDVNTPTLAGLQHVFEVNPAGGEWTVADVNAAEFGIRARAAG